MPERNGRFQEWNERRSSILDFAHGIYRKINANSGVPVLYTNVFSLKYLAADRVSTNSCNSVMCIEQTV